MKTITVKLSPALDSKLEALAKKVKKTKSVVVRLALEQLLREKSASEVFSAHDLLSDFCGAVEGKTKDLSYATRHMDDYGK
jgi:predicted DNA-binding protein